MEESYKDLNILEIVEKVERGADIASLAKHYGFPSTKTLRDILKIYYKEKRGIDIPRNVQLSVEDENEIYKLYYQGKNIDEISREYCISANHVNKILTKLRRQKSESREKKLSLELDNILDSLEMGVSLSKIAQCYNVSYSTLVSHLENTERGKKYLEENKNKNNSYPIKKKEISIEEIEEAYLSGKTDQLGVSEFLWRNRLKEKYGIDYVRILKPQNTSAPGQNKKQVKTMSRNQFNESIRSFTLDSLIAEATKRGIIVPEEYIKEYKEKTNNKTTNKLETPNDDDGLEI